MGELSDPPTLIRLSQKLNWHIIGTATNCNQIGKQNKLGQVLMPIKTFFCYAYEDKKLLEKLRKQLKPLEREGLIEMWYDGNISAGTEWEPVIGERLNTAEIILLLVSPDFMTQITATVLR